MKDNKVIWPVVTVISAMVIASGIYLGLQNYQSQPTIQTYPGVSSSYHTDSASEPLPVEQMARTYPVYYPVYQQPSVEPPASSPPPQINIDALRGISDPRIQQMAFEMLMREKYGY